MGVYIKEMKMPKDCNACFLDLYDRRTYCHNGEKALCPLIEVKAPHGRLIDAKLFFHEQWLHGTELNDMPTVIEEED